jgi:hypothetical protein
MSPDRLTPDQWKERLTDLLGCPGIPFHRLPSSIFSAVEDLYREGLTAYEAAERMKTWMRPNVEPDPQGGDVS